jgi:ABC-type oligopeptide transport system substrate-binding subunit
MNIGKKLILPGTVLMAGAVGMAGSSLLTSLSANAASTDSTGTSTNSSSSTSPPAQPDPTKGGHVANGITETVLTGDNATKATAAAQAAVPGATIIRVETDAEGATYEAHMKKSDGSSVTVKMDSSFNVTGTESGMGNMPNGGGTSSGSSTSQ